MCPWWTRSPYGRGLTFPAAGRNNTAADSVTVCCAVLCCVSAALCCAVLWVNLQGHG
jgi:hypothetical protein